MKSVPLLLGVLVVALLGCLSQNEIPHAIPCGDLSEWVGHRVVVTGCLRFACPSLLDFHFPKDCEPYLRDASGVAHLVFPEEAVSLREDLNAYYEESFTGCVLLSVQGKVGEQGCGAPSCVSWVFLEVEHLWFPGED